MKHHVLATCTIEVLGWYCNVISSPFINASIIIHRIQSRADIPFLCRGRQYMVKFQRVIPGGGHEKIAVWPYRPLSLYAFFVLRLLPCRTRQLANTCLCRIKMMNFKWIHKSGFILSLLKLSACIYSYRTFDFVKLSGTDRNKEIHKFHVK